MKRDLRENNHPLQSGTRSVPVSQPTMLSAQQQAYQMRKHQVQHMLILKSQTIETIAKTVGLKPISVRKIKNILQNESGEQKPQSERKHHQSQIRLPTNTKLQSLLPLWDQEQGNHRIIGTIMGISKQRVGQLVLEHRKDGVSLFDYPRQRKLDQIQVTRKDALQKLLKIQAY